MTATLAALVMLWQAPPTNLVQYTCDSMIVHVGTVNGIQSFNPFDSTPGYPFVALYDVLAVNCYPPQQ